jgi:DNA-binding NarL/FixJ family response regulator
MVLADDDVLLREGLASLFERRGFDVRALAGTAGELIAQVRSHLPDLVVTDIRMPPSHTTEGLVAARALREEIPSLAVLVLSAHVEVDQAIELVGTGSGVGYLLKSRVTHVDDFLDSVERVARGGSVVDPGVVQELVGSRTRSDPLGGLTDREREVLSLMAEGYSNLGIARRIYVAEGTVEKHVKSVLMKLDLPAADEEHRRVLAVLRFLDASTSS